MSGVQRRREGGIGVKESWSRDNAKGEAVTCVAGVQRETGNWLEGSLSRDNAKGERGRGERNQLPSRRFPLTLRTLVTQARELD